MTGEDLYQELVVAAGRSGKTLTRFAAPLFPCSYKIEQMRLARSPKPSTVERVRALCEGRPVPAPGMQCRRDPRSFGMTREESEQAGVPPSSRSLRERQQLQETMARRSAVERLRILTEIAHSSRRPGQTLHERVCELQKDFAA